MGKRNQNVTELTNVKGLGFSGIFRALQAERDERLASDKPIVLAEVKRTVSKSVSDLLKRGKHKKSNARRKRNKLKVIKQAIAEDNKVGTYFLAEMRTGISPHNTRAGTIYQIEKGTKVLIEKRLKNYNVFPLGGKNYQTIKNVLDGLLEPTILKDECLYAHAYRKELMNLKPVKHL